MDDGTRFYRRFLDGDENAFDGILDLYQESLIFYLTRYVHNPAIAEDIAADAFAALILYPNKYNFSVSLKTYLYMIARSRALDYLRRERRIKIFSLDSSNGSNGKDSENTQYTEHTGHTEQTVDIADTETESPETAFIKGERQKRVNEAVGKLKDEYKTAVHLVYFEDMSLDEVARVMKKSKKQVENILYRAKKALRAELAEDDII